MVYSPDDDVSSDEEETDYTRDSRQGEGEEDENEEYIGLS